MSTYKDKLKDPRWQKKRLEILSRDNFTCTKCNDDKSELHVHHNWYIEGLSPWDYQNKYLSSLCKYCHKAIHQETKIRNDGAIKIESAIKKLPLLEFYFEYIENHEGHWIFILKDAHNLRCIELDSDQILEFDRKTEFIIDYLYLTVAYHDHRFTAYASEDMLDYNLPYYEIIVTEHTYKEIKAKHSK